MVLLSVNAGSSSLKVSVFNRHDLQNPRASLAIEDIGNSVESPESATEQVKQWLTNELSIHPHEIEAIGHRVVHGGEQYDSAARITPELISYLSSITPLAPNHMPAALVSIEAFLALYPEALHVACFDTSFFQNRIE